MTLKMTCTQVVETSVNVSNNGFFQNYTFPDDHTRQTTDTPGSNQLQWQNTYVYLSERLFIMPD